MSEAPTPKFSLAGGVAPEVIVRGGTMSGRETNRIAAEEHAAEERRAFEAQKQQIAQTEHGPGSMASMRSKKLITQDSPRLVLWYRKHEQNCLSEITMVAGPKGLEPMFTMVCTKCLERGVPQGQAQLQVRSSHRSFAVDDTKAGPQRVEFGSTWQIVQVHGTVTVHDIIRCPEAGCGGAYKITDSRVEEV